MAGNYFYKIDLDFLSLTEGTVSGDTYFNSNLSASTYFSGATRLEDIMFNIAQKHLEDKQNLLNSSFSSYTGSTSTTEAAYSLMTGIQKSNLDIGNYLFSFGGWMQQSDSQGEIFTEIYLNGSSIAGSEMKFRTGIVGGGNITDINATHNYSNFPINITTNNSTVEVRWRVNFGTGTITNRYFTIFKI